MTRLDTASAEFSQRYLWLAVCLLALVNVFNYMDRMLLSVLLPSIQTDLGLSDTQLGLLTGLAFALFYAIAGIPIARLADTWVRKKIIALSLLAWSVMTALSGMAHSFWALAAARVGVGVGEAGCVPASQSMISDYLPIRRRPAGFAIHLAGATIGIIAGLGLGGALAQAIGWRHTFLIMGVAGVPLALVVLLALKEPVRGQSEQIESDVRRLDTRGALAELWRRPTYRHLVLVYGIANFSTIGINQWLPSFYSRSFSMSISEIGVFLGFALGAGMTVGTLLGGVLATRLMHRNILWGAWMCMIAAILAIPFTALIFLGDTKEVALTANFVSAALSGSTAGPITALVQSVAPPATRSLAAAIVGFAASLVGMGLGPLFIGLVSDSLTPSMGAESLRYALLFSAFIPAWAVVHLGIASKTLTRDIEMVSS